MSPSLVKSMTVVRTSRIPTGQAIPTFFPGPLTIRPAKVNLWKQQGALLSGLASVSLIVRREGWVVRTGAGYFSNIDHMNTWTILNLNPPLSGSNNFEAVTDSAQDIVLQGVVDRYPDHEDFRPGVPIITLDDPYLQKFGSGRLHRKTSIH